MIVKFCKAGFVANDIKEYEKRNNNSGYDPMYMNGE